MVKPRSTEVHYKPRQRVPQSPAWLPTEVLLSLDDSLHLVDALWEPSKSIKRVLLFVKKIDNITNVLRYRVKVGTRPVDCLGHEMCICLVVQTFNHTCCHPSFEGRLRDTFVDEKLDWSLGFAVVNPLYECEFAKLAHCLGEVSHLVPHDLGCTVISMEAKDAKFAQLLLIILNHFCFKLLLELEI